MGLQSVVGLPLAQARRVLASQGVLAVEEIVTAPPRRQLSDGEWRVVRQRAIGGTVELVTALFPALPRANSETLCC